MDDDIQQLLGERRYRHALELLLERYEMKVFRMALAFVKDPARAQDVTQDIFLKFWRALPDYDGRAAPSTWLYRIARNTCLSAVRSDSYRRTVPLEPPFDAVSSGFPRSPDLELNQCIDRLPEIQRTVIMLFYLEERRVDEVARLLAIPEGTVKSHLHRARLALAAMMKEER